MTNDPLHSTSEDNGLAAMPQGAIRIYSVGVSTAGVAEIRMAQASTGTKIIATTTDESGADRTRELIKDKGYEEQIDVKIEDICLPLPYADDDFDYVYARLVLHYLTRQQLAAALDELFRVLKSGGKLFVVVRSTNNRAATTNAISYDPETGMTTHTTKISEGSVIRQRFFHTTETITEFVKKAGFSIEYVKGYDEKLFFDFDRTIPSDHSNNLIEVLAAK